MITVITTILVLLVSVVYFLDKQSRLNYGDYEQWNKEDLDACDIPSDSSHYDLDYEDGDLVLIESKATLVRQQKISSVYTTSVDKKASKERATTAASKVNGSAEKELADYGALLDSPIEKEEKEKRKDINYDEELIDWMILQSSSEDIQRFDIASNIAGFNIGKPSPGVLNDERVYAFHSMLSRSAAGAEEKPRFAAKQVFLAYFFLNFAQEKLHSPRQAAFRAMPKNLKVAGHHYRRMEGDLLRLEKILYEEKKDAFPR
ncbi:hypothetical protein GCK32_005218 [Trichostrongylus colubriformis]|uniref:Uncharacterized protein n=1 Tax=Trichostrongylus colubriformis TaxID=6319 RepID=A0AAN8G0J4_TRICO